MAQAPGSQIAMDIKIPFFENSQQKYKGRIFEITGTLVANPKIRNWCRFPYPNHPKGCPNWNQHGNCPPKVPYIIDLFDLAKPHWFAAVEFNLSEHLKIMTKKHPDWTIRKLRCCLYWQNGVRKYLKMMCESFQNKYNETAYTLLPEAMGVDVFKTAFRHGLMLKKNPNEKVFKIAMIGYLLRKQR